VTPSECFERIQSSIVDESIDKLMIDARRHSSSLEDLVEFYVRDWDLSDHLYQSDRSLEKWFDIAWWILEIDNEDPFLLQEIYNVGQ